MKVEQIYTGCLAEAAYYIQSENEAVIIDPLRESSPYIERARKNGATIKYILETHFHADFVSGHVELAQKTGATIVYGPNAETGFKAHIAKDGELLKVGKVTIEVLHTPGHTLESTCYLLRDDNNLPYALFTGDTLFIGDVGRPDLAVKSHFSVEDLAGMLFDSIQNKIMTLPEHVILYPGHGAGSACGKNIGKETFDTLGNQKLKNYALKAKDKVSFIKAVTEGILPPPAYFPKNAWLNKQGAPSLDSIKETALNPLDPAELEHTTTTYGTLILDTRDAEDFAESHIPGSINIGLSGQFAPWVGALVPDIKQPIVFIADEGKEEEVFTRLCRVGYDHVLGYLHGGIAAWKSAGKSLEVITRINADLIDQLIQTHHILDVRKPDEYNSAHIADLPNMPLDYINDWIIELDSQKNYVLHCAGGYRSMIAASILKSRGFPHIVDVRGGFDAIVKYTSQLVVTAACTSQVS